MIDSLPVKPTEFIGNVALGIFDIQSQVAFDQLKSSRWFWLIEIVGHV